jgi:hypothetical protein
MRLLRLKPADEMALGLAGYAFKGAKFTWVTESDEYERWIAASRGEYSIMWNLRRCAHCHAASHVCTLSCSAALPPRHDVTGVLAQCCNKPQVDY